MQGRPFHAFANGSRLKKLPFFAISFYYSCGYLSSLIFPFHPFLLSPLAAFYAMFFIFEMYRTLSVKEVTFSF